MDTLIILGLGILIMLARMIDVTIGTLRVISVIDGRMKTAFMLGFIEVMVWLVVISMTLERVKETPILAFFFALGFSLGNVLGIYAERHIPLGNLTLRIVGGQEVQVIAQEIRAAGLGATVLKGEGSTGERLMLFSFLRKSMLSKVLAILKPRQDRIFYTLDYGGSANRVLVPAADQPRSARRLFRRK